MHKLIVLSLVFAISTQTTTHAMTSMRRLASPAARALSAATSTTPLARTVIIPPPDVSSMLEARRDFHTTTCTKNGLGIFLLTLVSTKLILMISRDTLEMYETWHEGVPYSSRRLISAINNSDLSLIEECIRNGTSINSNHAGEMPLMLAIKNNDLSVVRLLLSFGALPNVHILDDRHIVAYTTLSYAISRHYNDIATTLMDANVNIDNCDGNGNNALHCAIMFNNVTMAKDLITERNMSPFQPNTGGNNAFDLIALKTPEKQALFAELLTK